MGMGMGMGSTEEPEKSSPSSSPSHPFLSKSRPTAATSSSTTVEGGGEEEDTHYLLHHQTDLIESDENQYPQITFNYGPRQFQDLPFLILFLLFALSTFGFGIFSIAHTNPNYHLSSSSFVYDLNTTSCVKNTFPPPPPPPTTSNGNGNYLMMMMNSTSSSSSSSSWWAAAAAAAASASASASSHHHLIEDLIWTLVVTFLLTGPFALGLLWLLRHYTKQLVYASLPFFVVFPIFFNVYWFVACTLSSTCTRALPLPYRILVLLFVFVIIGVIVWIIVANWHRIELTVRIVQVASDALARNLSLFLVLPSLVLALLLFFAPIVVFLVFAPRNGNIVPLPTTTKKGGGGAHDDEAYSCVWKQDAWVPAYYALAIVTILWSAAAMVEAQVFVISGTIAQWYFSKEEDSTTPPIRRSIRTSSLRNAFGPSFGTVCFSGLLIGAVRVLRAAVDSARREDIAPGIVNLIMRCCVNALFSTVDFLNKFTINFAAITGEAYCSSAQMTYELLKRNLLSAVFVETVSTRILAGIIFVLSAIYAIAVCGILKAVSNLEVEVYFVAALAWVLLIMVLGFFVHVLDNVIETVYVCFAIDRDKGEVFKQEVHDVYVHLPISRNHRPSLATRTPLLV